LAARAPSTDIFGQYGRRLPPYGVNINTTELTFTRYRLEGLIKIVEGWGELPTIWADVKIWFLANFGLLLVETLNMCVGFFCTYRQYHWTVDSENLNEIALLEFEKNSVEFWKKNACLSR